MNAVAVNKCLYFHKLTNIYTQVFWANDVKQALFRLVFTHFYFI